MAEKMSDLMGYGLRCPKCGYDEHLYISITAEARVAPDGVEDYGDHIEWDDDSQCGCPGCAHQATVKDFSIMGEQITSLEGLKFAAAHQRSVISPSHPSCNKPLPAVAVLNWQGRMILHAFSAGLYLYNARGKDYGTK